MWTGWATSSIFHLETELEVGTQSLCVWLIACGEVCVFMLVYKACKPLYP